jgi:type IV pilus assembly protein PilB
MADVDAVRHLASEHDLEFVDLDDYGVDPAASEILPAGLARQHHMVAIKRKFGTPVIAIADPADDDGHDAIRDAIGRDFISVVASEGQITDYLDRVFGPASEGDRPSGRARRGRKQAEEPAEAPTAGEAEALGRSLVELEVEELGAVEHESNGKTNGLASMGLIDAAALDGQDELSAVLESLTDVSEADDPVDLATDFDERPERDQDGVDDGNSAAGTDSDSDSEDLADLVAEAVATYQEQHGEVTDDGDVDGEPETAAFPMLAKALVAGERVSVDDMRSAVEESQLSGQNVAHVLMARGLVTEADLMWGMAQEMGLEFVDLDTVGINYTAVATLPEATARHHNVIVIAEEDGRPVVAASNPTDVFAMDDLRTIIGRRFKVVVATRSQITSYIDKAFDSGADEAAMEASMGIDSVADGGPDDIQAVTEEAPIVRYVNLLILQALNERASDIHIEPTGGELRIRYRIDGVLHDVSNAPRSIRSAVTTRLKVMADMNIAEHRIPQDGRISLNVGSKGIDLRMATLPTINGEKVVMRVLDKSSVVLGFTDLGFDEDLIEKYEHIYTKPYGTILVTGPTGSGKSTTLYTTLSALNSPEKNIITVEDPVELPLKGISQIQLNPRAGLTFASALRAILRSDPDIVLVGEIRDKETALISVEAALTGHLVLSTLHTNNAAATPMRLIEMGLEPFLVTSALTGVLAQRLARRLCLHCKEAYEPTEADIVAAGWSTEEVEAIGIDKVYRSVGCSACSNTGYRGRKALAELLPMTEEVERMIIEGGSMEDIHRLGVSQGMVTLRQSGLRKALEGETTLEEVLRVVA